MFALYGAALRLAWAALLPYQIVMAALSGRPGPRLRERLARGAPPDGLLPGGFWLHAVSFGEVRLAHAVITGLRRRFPGAPVHLTTATATGRELAEAARRERLPGAADSVSLPPLDLPGPIDRFHARLRPRALILIETELWPNLLRLTARHGVPILILNGRLSARAWPRYQRWRRLFAPGLERVALVAAQSEADAQRFRQLGVPAERVRALGNLKFDLPLAPGDPAAVRRRLGAGAEDAILAAGSTARGEEAAVVQAFAALRQVSRSARLVIAPRHPEDVDRAEQALARAGWTVRRWSTLHAAPAEGGGAAAPPADAVVVDVMGVLPSLYPAATIAFVGGSLVPRGGQNLLEPAAAGIPVLFGPRIENVRFAAEALLASGGGFQADDAASLALLVARLGGDAAARAEAGRRARATVAEHRGALDRSLDLAGRALQVAPGGAAA